jgi:hypothetical protein
MPVDFEIRFRRNHAHVLMRGYNSLKLSGKGMSADSFNLMFFGIHCLLICRLSEHCEAFFSNIPLATIAYTLTRASKPTPPWRDFELKRQPTLNSSRNYRLPSFGRLNRSHPFHQESANIVALGGTRLGTMTKAESMDDPTNGKEETISARKQQKQQVGVGVITRAQRRAIEQRLRSQATGVGIALEKSVNKKIVFDDNVLPVDDVEHGVKYSSNVTTSPLQAAVVLPLPVSETEYPQDQLDDDDDDKVEEVKASTAQDMALEQRQEERLTARTSNWIKKMRRKRKATATTAFVIPDPTVFDDEFFQRIDQERQDERQRRKMKACHGETEGTVATGRHTTFVVATREDAVGTASKPKPVGHGVEIVVLGCDHHKADTWTHGDSGGNVPYSMLTGQSLLESNKETPSPAVVLYSRYGILSDGSVPLSSKQSKKMKQAGHVSSHRQEAPTWQRSKKMRVVAFGTRKQPKAAAEFVVSRR